MFERFTDAARRVIVLSQEEARRLGSSDIGTEHLLLGLLREGEDESEGERGVATEALSAFGITLESVRQGLGVGPGIAAPAAPLGNVPFSNEAKTVLELSLREALTMGHNYIGTEHILLGLIREPDGLAGRVLVSQGADLDRLRRQVLAHVRASTPRWFSGPPRGPLEHYHPRTPAAAAIERQALRGAEGTVIGSHHYLLALLEDENSMAARLLAHLGVVRDLVAKGLESMEVAGTTDETPDAAAARKTSVAVDGDRLVITVGDDDMVALIRAAVAAHGGRVTETFAVSGADPDATVALRRMWLPLRTAIEELARALGPGPEPAPPPPPEAGAGAA